ncbi:MAG: DNA-binding protein [Burkholderiales bacterium]|jgi:hypothetical protein|nr:DNA-binding protein [Burkholderiales bacterium]
MSDNAEALFSSSHNALLFAFSYSLQQRAPSPMDRLFRTPRTGKGLSGLDGAAQAGMIRAELEAVGEYAVAVLTSRVAPRSISCECRRPCCCGHRANPEWSDAIGWLAMYMVRELAGTATHYRLRRGSVERYFGVGVKLGALADLCGVHRNTAGEHNAKIMAALKKEESRAWRAIDDRLQAAGVVA